MSLFSSLTPPDNRLDEFTGLSYLQSLRGVGPTLHGTTLFGRKAKGGGGSNSNSHTNSSSALLTVPTYQQHQSHTAELSNLKHEIEQLQRQSKRLKNGGGALPLASSTTNLLTKEKNVSFNPVANSSASFSSLPHTTASGSTSLDLTSLSGWSHHPTDSDSLDHTADEGRMASLLAVRPKTSELMEGRKGDGAIAATTGRINSSSVASLSSSSTTTNTTPSRMSNSAGTSVSLASLLQSSYAASASTSVAISPLAAAASAASGTSSASTSSLMKETAERRKQPGPAGSSTSASTSSLLIPSSSIPIIPTLHFPSITSSPSKPTLTTSASVRTLSDELHEIEQEKRVRAREKKVRELGLDPLSINIQAVVNGGNGQKDEKEEKEDDSVIFPAINNSTNQQPESTISTSFTSHFLSSSLLSTPPLSSSSNPHASLRSWESSSVHIDLSTHSSMFHSKITEYTHRLTQKLQRNLDLIRKKCEVQEVQKMNSIRNEMRDILRFYHSHEMELHDVHRKLREDERVKMIEEEEEENLKKQQQAIHEDYEMQYQSLMEQLVEVQKEKEGSGGRGDRSNGTTVMRNPSPTRIIDNNNHNKNSSSSHSTTQSRDPSRRGSMKIVTVSDDMTSPSSNTTATTPRHAAPSSAIMSKRSSLHMMQDSSSNLKDVSESGDTSDVVGDGSDADPTSSVASLLSSAASISASASSVSLPTSTHPSLPSSHFASSAASRRSSQRISANLMGGSGMITPSTVNTTVASPLPPAQLDFQSRLTTLKQTWYSTFQSIHQLRDELKLLKTQHLSLSIQKAQELEEKRRELEKQVMKEKVMKENLEESREEWKKEEGALRDELNTSTTTELSLHTEVSQLDTELHSLHLKQELLYNTILAHISSTAEIRTAYQHMRKEVCQKYFTEVVEKSHVSILQAQDVFRSVHASFTTVLTCSSCQQRLSSSCIRWDTYDTLCEKCSFNELFPVSVKNVVKAVQAHVVLKQQQQTNGLIGSKSVMSLNTTSSTANSSPMSASNTPRRLSTQPDQTLSASGFRSHLSSPKLSRSGSIAPDSVAMSQIPTATSEAMHNDLGALLVSHLHHPSNTSSANVGERVRRGSLGGIVEAVVEWSEAQRQQPLKNLASPVTMAGSDVMRVTVTKSASTLTGSVMEVGDGERGGTAGAGIEEIDIDEDMDQVASSNNDGTKLLPLRVGLTSPTRQLQELSEVNSTRARTRAHQLLPFSSLSLRWLKNHVCDQWSQRYDAWRDECERDIFAETKVLPQMIKEVEKQILLNGTTDGAQTGSSTSSPSVAHGTLNPPPPTHVRRVSHMRSPSTSSLLAAAVSSFSTTSSSSTAANNQKPSIGRQASLLQRIPSRMRT